MPRHNIWEQLWESTEGPTVTLQLPRDVAETLLHMISSALEVDGGGDGFEDDGDMPGGFGDDDDMDLPGEDPVTAGGFPGGDEDMDDMGGLHLDASAGEPEDDDDAGRPNAKSKKSEPPKKDKKPEKKKGDDDEDDKPKKESRLTAFIGSRGRR